MLSRLNDLESHLRKQKFLSLDNEKRLQSEILKSLQGAGFDVEPEVSLNKTDRIDFMIGEIGIEVKIKGSSVQVLKQVERYCESDRVKIIVLLTSRAHGFPSEINGKPVRLIRLCGAWL